MRELSMVAKSGITAALVAALALSGCTANDVESVRAETQILDTIAPASPRLLPAPGGVIRRGDSYATMADQYTPGAGTVVATGASAWVKPAPPPAFVVSGSPPPADPPAPPPAAVANRQPAANAAPASDIVRPEAAAPDPAPDPSVRPASLALFNNYSCGACHALADAGAGGSIGPSLDGNPRLTRDFAIDVIAHGRGAMPSFAGQMTDEEIARLADYIVQFSRK